LDGNGNPIDPRDHEVGQTGWKENGRGGQAVLHGQGDGDRHQDTQVGEGPGRLTFPSLPPPRGWLAGCGVEGGRHRFTVGALRGVRHTVGVIHVRLFGAARAAAGEAECDVDVVSLNALVGWLSRAHGDEMARVLARCSFLVDGVAVKDRTSDQLLPVGSSVDVLPPFAGG
jgi:molybdopterin converting factor small subunit